MKYICYSDASSVRVDNLSKPEIFNHCLLFFCQLLFLSFFSMLLLLFYNRSFYFNTFLYTLFFSGGLFEIIGLIILSRVQLCFSFRSCLCYLFPDCFPLVFMFL